MVYENNSGGEYAAHFVQTLQTPSDMGTTEFQEMYKQFAKRILWMDGDVCHGAFQMNTSWYCKVPDRDPLFEEHCHPYDELIGFFGSDPDTPYDLHAEIEFSIEGEVHKLNRSTLIFVPSGLKHNPLRLLRVDRPIFHFSVVMNQKYDGKEVYK